MHVYYRWSDNDRRFGRFIYSYSARGYRPLGIMLASPGEESPCTLRVSAFGHTFIALLPAVIRPFRNWVDTSHYEWSKSPNSGYWDVHKREFGFSFSDGSLHVHYGAQTHCWPGTKSKVYFLPWRSWRHVRHSLYNLQGAHFADLPQGRFLDTRDATEALENACPAATFAFKDFDGEELTARCRIEEREWHLGEGRFKWLSVFRKPRIERYIDIRFSGETGKRKGSWKGGTIGHSGPVLRDQLHEAAFRDYCAKHDMTFIGAVEPESVPA